MKDNIIKNWFGNQFSSLHPLLQQVHLQPTQLNGEVTITYGNGLAGFIGRRVARRLNIPKEGVHTLTVNISHNDKALYWNRTFNSDITLHSTFTPVGTLQNGYWIETTGALTLLLTVNIKNGGWYWECLKYKIYGLTLPKCLFPTTQAYKKIETGKYKFYVGFSFPVLGTLFSYSGLLNT